MTLARPASTLARPASTLTRSASRGFSIVELMVAVTLSLVVTAAVLSVFVASRASYSRTSGTASLSDGGRFALDFLQQSVRAAGYIVCAQATNNSSIVNPASFTSALAAFNSQGLAGYEATGTEAAGAYSVPSASPASPIPTDATLGDWIGGLDASLVSEVVKNNDVLVVYTTAANAQPSYITSIANGATTFQVNALGSLAANGHQLIAISDCSKSVVMWSTVAISGTAPYLTVTHDTTGGLNSGGTLPAAYSFSAGSQVAPVDAAIYYIGQGEDGDGALFRNDLNSGANAPSFQATELVPDIEAMQILYGIDSTGTQQTVDDYVTADEVPIVSPNGWNGVISVKIALLAASQLNAVQKPTVANTYTLLGTTVTAPLDTRARQVFEMTIGLRNQSQ
jgi:type IV pilus assembly protein PilW